MRKDIFVVLIRVLGVWQLVGSLGQLANLISQWIGYMQPQTYGSRYIVLHFGLELVIGLYFVLRPYHLFHLIERFAENDDEIQAESEAK
jgi:hypothetical protein